MPGMPPVPALPPLAVLLAFGSSFSLIFSASGRDQRSVVGIDPVADLQERQRVDQRRDRATSAGRSHPRPSSGACGLPRGFAVRSTPSRTRRRRSELLPLHVQAEVVGIGRGEVHLQGLGVLLLERLVVELADERDEAVAVELVLELRRPRSSSALPRPSWWPRSAFVGAGDPLALAALGGDSSSFFLFCLGERARRSSSSSAPPPMPPMPPPAMPPPMPRLALCFLRRTGPSRPPRSLGMGLPSSSSAMTRTAPRPAWT